MKSRKNTANQKAYAGKPAVAWLLYLILVSCTLTCVTLAKYSTTVSGTGIVQVAEPICELVGNPTIVGDNTGGSEEIIVDSSLESGSCVFRVRNYKQLDGNTNKTTEVAMVYKVMITSEPNVTYTVHLADIEGIISPDDIGIAADANGSAEINGRTLPIAKEKIDTYVIKFNPSTLSDPVSFKVVVTASQVIE